MVLIDTRARGGLLNTSGLNGMRNIIDTTPSLLGCINGISPIELYLNITDTNIYRAYSLYQSGENDAFPA